MGKRDIALNGTGAHPKQRALIVKLSSLGDLFHALPVLPRLTGDLGLCVDWVTQPEYAELVRQFVGMDRVIIFPRRGFVRGLPVFIRQVRATPYACALDLQGLFKSGLATWLARAPRKIGPSFHREGSRMFYTEVAGPRTRDRHAVEECLDTVRHLGLSARPPEFPVAFPEAKIDAPRPRIAMIPCSRWSTKNWPAERFAETGAALQEKFHASIFLIGAPADDPICARIAQRLHGPVVNLCGKTGLVELGGILREMDLVITVDSGPMHMAAALGRTVLAVFGATDPRKTGPYGAQHAIIARQDLDCRPCRSRNCARQDLACLNDLPASRVIERALKILGGMSWNT